MNLLFPLNANIPVSPRAQLLACQERMWFMVSIGQYLVVWSGIIINEGWTGKDVGGSGHGTIDVISRYMPGATEEQYKILNQDSRCPSSESTPAHRTEVQLAPWISKIWFFSQKSRFVLRCSGLWRQIMFRRNILPPFSEQVQEEVRFYEVSVPTYWSIWHHTTENHK
jgi:hypothetical protein